MNTVSTLANPTHKAIREDFLDKGYALFSEVISQERVKEIREFLTNEFNEQYPVENYNEANIIFDHLVKYPNLRDTIANEKIINSLKILLGDELVLMPPASCIRNSFWNLHTDVTTMTSQGYPVSQRPDFTGVAIAIYLQDNDEQGGGMFVVPETHKLEKDPLVNQKLWQKGINIPFGHKILRALTGNRYPNYDDFSKYEIGGIDIPSKAGDMLVLDMRLLHRGSQVQPGVKKTRTKLGIFTTATAPGEGNYLDYWMEYLMSDHDHPFQYLKNERNTEPVKQTLKEAGFSAVYH